MLRQDLPRFQKRPNGRDVVSGVAAPTIPRPERDPLLFCWSVQHWAAFAGLPQTASLPHQGASTEIPETLLARSTHTAAIANFTIPISSERGEYLMPPGWCPDRRAKTAAPKQQTRSALPLRALLCRGPIGYSSTKRPRPWTKQRKRASIICCVIGSRRRLCSAWVIDRRFILFHQRQLFARPGGDGPASIVEVSAFSHRDLQAGWTNR